jgi:hypothetical protein
MRAKKLIAAIIDGVALPGALIERRSFSRPAGSDLERIRGDVERVGATFREVIDREHGHQKITHVKTGADTVNKPAC